MLRPLCHLLLVFSLLALTGGCQHEKTLAPVRLSGQTMGTSWSVVVLPGAAGPETQKLQQLLQNRLDQINGLMSTYLPQSEVSRFNDRITADWVPVSPEMAQVIDLSLQISRLTDGAFDITVGPLVELWGFGASARSEKIPSAGQVGETLARVGFVHLQLQQRPAALSKQVPGLRIDLSAVAKGYAVDALADLLERQGFGNYLLEIGGEMRLAGQRGDGTAWKVAIEKPLEDTREVAAVFPLTNIGLATSGNYRNFYIEDGQRYSHTIDPVSGQPARHKLASVTVLDRSCARADALATALMVMGEVKGRTFCEANQIAAYFLIHENESLTVYMSPAFQQFLAEGKP